jgi:hypothetical protein
MSEQLPDSALATGSDAGTPGEPGPGEQADSLDDLSPEERAVLEALRRPGSPVADPVEEGERAARAVRDDSPL